MGDRTSRLKLAQLVSGDLGPDEARALEAELAESENSQHQLADIRKNVAEYEADADRHMALLRSRLIAEQSAIGSDPASAGSEPEFSPKPATLGGQPTGRQGPWWRRLRYYFPAVATAAAAALIALLFYTRGFEEPPKPDVAFKGVLAVKVVAKRGAQQFMVKSGQRMAEGDALRFIVTTDGPGYISVFSVDGRGKVSPFYPEADPRANPAPLHVDRAGRHVLEGSVILDNALGLEHLVVVFSPERFERATVHRRIRRQLEPGAPVPRFMARTVGLKGSIEVITIEKVAEGP
jgi:hypothetical protein